MQNASEHPFCRKIQGKSQAGGAYSAGAYKKRVYIEPCQFMFIDPIAMKINVWGTGDHKYNGTYLHRLELAVELVYLHSVKNRKIE